MRRLQLRKRERIAIVRARLNEGFPKLPAHDPMALRWFIMGCINVLDGDETVLNAAERKRVQDWRGRWLRLRQ